MWKDSLIHTKKSLDLWSTPTEVKLTDLLLCLSLPGKHNILFIFYLVD